MWDFLLVLASHFVSVSFLFRILKEAEKRDKAEQLRKERERGIEEKRRKQVQCFIIFTSGS